MTLNPHQFRQQIDDKILAGDLFDMSEPRVGEVSKGEHINKMWNRKLKETQGSGLYSSIANHGVTNPVVIAVSPYIGGYTIVDGHHRLVAANDIDEDMEIPVKYHHDENEW